MALAVSLEAAEGALGALLDGVEKRYNGARTLQVTFQETFSAAGRRPRAESGELYLRKPGRMRWDYSAPAGKLFLSDGTLVYYYNPDTNRAERTKFKETEDMRAPLAFLLGRLTFDKDFREFQSKPSADGTVISAIPKSDRLPYKHVEFTVAPDYSIRKLIVTGQDGSLLTFAFAAEKLNPALKDDMFRFELPAGAQWVDFAGQEASR